MVTLQDYSVGGRAYKIMVNDHGMFQAHKMLKGEVPSEEPVGGEFSTLHTLKQHLDKLAAKKKEKIENTFYLIARAPSCVDKIQITHKSVDRYGSAKYCETIVGTYTLSSSTGDLWYAVTPKSNNNIGETSTYINVFPGNTTNDVIEKYLKLMKTEYDAREAKNAFEKRHKIPVQTVINHI